MDRFFLVVELETYWKVTSILGIQIKTNGTKKYIIV